MSGYRNTVARGPSRLREVYNIDLAQDDLPNTKNTVVVNVNEAATYELGDEITSYAEAFVNGQNDEVFGESGILAAYFSVGQEKWETVLQNEGTDVESEQHWQLECRTWDLVQRLYMERVKDKILDHQVHQYSSNRALEDRLYITDSGSAETKIVLDWLQDGYIKVDEKFKVRGNRWFYTKEAIKTRERLGKNIQAEDSEIVSALDPDAPIRQGKRLEERDEEFERSLTKAMFYCIRGGNFAEAADLARQSGNHWRAASIQGCIEYSHPLIDNGALAQAPEGNINKPLWRRMCFALARQPGINLFEKAMYGALCGDLLSVLPVCRTWEDRVWASFNAMNQSQVEAHLRAFKRVEISQDFPIDDTSTLTSMTVLNGLLHNEDENIRTEAFSPFRVIQARLITNQVGELLRDMHGQLKSVQQGGNPTAATNPHIIRFVAHLILVLRQLGQEVPEEAAVAIVQAYVELLVSVRQGDAIALYAAQLPMDAAVESVAHYLVNVEDEEERKEQLRLIVESGIDAKATILRTVEIVFEGSMEELGTEPADTNIQAELDEMESRAIRALEWVKLGDNLQDESILLGNVLYRRLLLSKRTSAARSLDTRMPDNLLIPHDMNLLAAGDQSEDVEQRMRNAIEYLGHSTMVRALARYEAWKVLVRERPQEVNGRRDPIGLRQWRSDLSNLKNECALMLSELLDNSWCDPVRLQIPADQPGYEELQALRNMYIPDIILKLHGVYSAQEGRDVAAAMDLAVLVAERLTGPMKSSGLLPVYVKEISMLGSYLA